jgi:nicotinamidase-related amidase
MLNKFRPGIKAAAIAASLSLLSSAGTLVAADYEPETTAILLVDPFNDFLSPEGKAFSFGASTIESANLIENLKDLLHASRTAGVKVVYVPHRHYEEGAFQDVRYLNPAQASIQAYHVFEKGSWGAEYHPDLAKQSGDHEAEQHLLASGFVGTNLHALLQGLNVDHVVIAGMRAPTCIEATAHYAVELGYHTTLLSDGIAAFGQHEVDAVVDVSFPAYGHEVMKTDQFIGEIAAD